MRPHGRRRFLRSSLALAALGLLAGCGTPPWPGRQAARVPRVGFLGGNVAEERSEGFRAGMRDLGYLEGQNVVIEWRFADGRLERLPELAAELVRLPVDVLVADGTAAVRPAKDATDTIPIVMAQSVSPVENGFVASLARPGGNVTGLASIARELIGKRLELLKAAVPNVSRVGVLWNPGMADRVGEFQLAEVAAGTLGLELRSLEARDPAAIDSALERALLERADGLALFDNLVLTSNAARIGEFAREHRLPMMAGNRRFATAGGLLAYGANDPDMARRAADYVDKILKGAKPADLPVEGPSLFDFVVNLRTARALALTIPLSVLQQATEVIQ